MSEESEPFIAPSSEKVKKQRTSRLLIVNITVHVLLISLYAVASLIFINYRVRSSCWPQVSAIDQLKVEVSPGSFDFYKSTDFVGSPGPETDALWDELLSDRYIRVSKEELSRNERSSVELPGGGYLAWIGVFHELHCVNLLWQWRHKDYYFVNSTQDELEKVEKHLDHCLDRIRATLICHPDFSSLTTFFWDIEPQPKVNGTKTLHSCINWDAMIASSRHRVVQHKEIVSLKNPLIQQ